MLAPTISVDSRGVGVLAPTISVDSERHGASIVMLVADISVDLQRLAVQLQIDTATGSKKGCTVSLRNNTEGSRQRVLPGALAATLIVDSERHFASIFMVYETTRFCWVQQT